MPQADAGWTTAMSKSTKRALAAAQAAKDAANKSKQESIEAIAKADKIQFVNGLPKTRSGKIMRRILRKIAAGESDNLGDISTLLDPAVVEEIKITAQ